MRKAVRWFGNGVGILVLLGALAVVAGGLLRRPVLFGLIPSDSMNPVLERGDLVLILPPAVTREVTAGTVIVFRGQDVPWVAHRIMGGDAEAGFVTMGDANPRPDSLRVLPADIVGVVPAVGDGLVRIPRVGNLAARLGGFRQPVVVALLLAAGIGTLVFERRKRVITRRTSNRWPAATIYVWTGLAATVWVVITLQSLVSISRIEGNFAVVEFSKDGLQKGQVVVDQTRSDSLRLHNPFPMPVAFVVIPETPGVHATPDRMLVPPRGTVEYQLTISGDRPAGTHPFAVRRSAFLPVLPLNWLYRLAVIGSFAVAATVALVPTLLVMALGLTDASFRAASRVWLLRLIVRVS